MQVMKVPRKLIGEGAQFAASRLVRYAEGALDDPTTWQGVAQQMGVRVYLYEVHCPTTRR
jgi:hypothetical protein